ncbi:MAG: DMT family transporter [Bacteroidota bacterium]
MLNKTVTSEKQLLSGIGLAILGIVLFSSKAVFVKYAYTNYTVKPLDLLGFRMAFSLPAYLVILWRSKVVQPALVKRKDWIYLILLGCLGYYVASYFDFLGLQYVKASIERIILFIYPTFVLLINRWFLKIPITPRQIIAILLTYLGVLVTFWVDLDLEGQQILVGGALIMVSAVTYAVYLVGSGWYIPKFGTQKFTALTMTAAASAVFLHFLLENGFQLPYYPAGVYMIGIMIAVFATVLPSFLISEAIKRIGSSQFSIIAGLGPFSTILLATIFLGESLTILQILGTVLVIVGIIFSTEKMKKND